MASDHNPVKLLDHCKISPTPPSSSNTSLSLLFFDLFWLRFHPNQRIFFYQCPQPTPKFLSQILPKLKESLSVTLGHFLPLAGHLTWSKDSNKPYVEYCLGDGVFVTVAEAEADFDLLCGDGFVKAKLFYPLLPELSINGTNRVPVVAIQITLFPNKGFSIGFSVHHAVMDGKSFSLFIHSWASVCRNTVLSNDLQPLFDRDIVRIPPHLESVFLNNLLEANGPNNKSLEMWDMKPPSGLLFGTFKLPISDIEKLKKSVRSKLEKEYDQNFLISTFTIASAFMWACLYKTHKVSSEKVRLAISVDCRTRLDPIVPSNYFGNCIAPCFVDVNSSDLIKEEAVAVAAAAKAIAEALTKLDDKFLNDAETWISELYSAQEDTIYSIAGSPRFKLYGADFGWGRPNKIEMISIDKTGAFYLSDDRDNNGGIEIGVALKEHQVEDFASIFQSLLEGC